MNKNISFDIIKSKLESNLDAPIAEADKRHDQEASLKRTSTGKIKRNWVGKIVSENSGLTVAQTVYGPVTMETALKKLKKDLLIISKINPDNVIYTAYLYQAVNTSENECAIPAAIHTCKI